MTKKFAKNLIIFALVSLVVIIIVGIVQSIAMENLLGEQRTHEEELENAEKQWEYIKNAGCQKVFLRENVLWVECE